MVLRKFTGKHLCQSLFFNKVVGLRPATIFKKRLWHRYFPVNFVKFLRISFLQNTSGRLLLLFSLPINQKRYFQFLICKNREYHFSLFIYLSYVFYQKRLIKTSLLVTNFQQIYFFFISFLFFVNSRKWTLIIKYWSNWDQKQSPRGVL